MAKTYPSHFEGEEPSILASRTIEKLEFKGWRK